MTNKTHYIGFDREKAVDSATTGPQLKTVTALPGSPTDPESGRHCEDSRRANEPRVARTIVQFILADRRMRIDQRRLMAHRPPFAVQTELEGVVVRNEFYEGHEPLECTDDTQSAALTGKDLPEWIERDAHTSDQVAFLAECWGMPPDINRPTVQAIQDPDAPGPAQTYREPSLADQPDDTMVPMTVLDCRVPQRGWEHEYGVPSYLVGAAADLYHHRKRVANPDVAVIDAAILRLYGPWITQDAASSPIKHEDQS
jgi:hypothetical protein